MLCKSRYGRYNPQTWLTKGNSCPWKYVGRGMHLVHILGSPDVGNSHRQHGAILAPTPVKPLQGDPFLRRPQSEADCCG